MPIPEEELRQRLRSGYDAFNRGDYDAAAQWLHPDVAYAGPGGISEVTGAGALRAWMEPDAFEGQVSEVLGLEIDGNRALIRQHTRARGAGSGIEMEVGSWAVWTFDDEGKVTRIETYLETEEDQARRSFRAP
jgi:ketosteroid isomerase-like protein